MRDDKTQQVGYTKVQTNVMFSGCKLLEHGRDPPACQPPRVPLPLSNRATVQFVSATNVLLLATATRAAHT